MDPIPVYLEIGKKYTFASALEWPGWCRRGRRSELALQALVDYAPRYAEALGIAGLQVETPVNLDALEIVERLEGNATTDFGAPAVMFDHDQEPLDIPTGQRYMAILTACWRVFDQALVASAGKELRIGPRGGGRDQEKMQLHVLQADLSYLRAAGWRHKDKADSRLSERMHQSRQAILATLQAAVAGSLPKEGPRGGKIWPPRFFVRRVAWHVLDHAWEIEDRIVEA